MWCTRHQVHLIVKPALTSVDNFAFTEDPLPAKYWTALSAVVNFWRSPGSKRKLFENAERLLDPLEASLYHKTAGDGGQLEDISKR